MRKRGYRNGGPRMGSKWQREKNKTKPVAPYYLNLTPTPKAPDPAPKIRTLPPHRISTQHVSLPNSQFSAAGAGRLPRAPHIRTRNAGSVMDSCRGGELALRFHQFGRRAGQPLGEQPRHLNRKFRKLPEQLKKRL